MRPHRDLPQIYYGRLFQLCAERNTSVSAVIEKAGLSTNIIGKFTRQQNMSLKTIDAVCMYLGVQPDDIMEIVEAE